MGAPSVGDVVGGKYRLVRSLGRGGEGRVFLARHLLLNTSVALKFMHPHVAHTKASVARFTREARAAATLKSDHVARILDVAERSSGEPYIVMEHLEGYSLDTIAKSGRGLPIADAVKIAVQACDALGEAHSRGIVHRDVKPANLFLTTGKTGESMIKILDFGLGTPSYMSPEQVGSGREVTARTDIWSLGVTLYELLTARPAFDGESEEVIFACILQASATPVRLIRPDVPDALAAIIDRCLKRDPVSRFSSMESLARALQRPAVSSIGPAVAPVTTPRPSTSVTCQTGQTPAAMIVPALPPRLEPSVHQTLVAALAGPALVAMASTFMAVWLGASAGIVPPRPTRAIVAALHMKSGDTTRRKDPSSSSVPTTIRCAKGARGPTCSTVARN